MVFFEKENKRINDCNYNKNKNCECNHCNHNCNKNIL